jgi:hypothetical protein
MNDPRYPYHAISDCDFLGQPPFVSRLPRDEDDFASVEEARAFVRHTGGVIDKHNGERFVRWEAIPPEGGDTALIV